MTMEDKVLLDIRLSFDIKCKYRNLAFPEASMNRIDLPVETESKSLSVLLIL